MSFLSPNKQHQSTESIITEHTKLHVLKATQQADHWAAMTSGMK